jgi:hypothetical protein
MGSVDNTGVVDADPVRPLPTGAGGGRRHRFALEGWCEGCRSRVYFTFKSHKGSTFVSASTTKSIPLPAS